MTPDEDLEIQKKVSAAESASSFIAIAIGLIVVVLMIVFLSMSDDDEDGEFIGYLVGFVALAISSFLSARIYRKHLERKLGRRLKHEYELTSLSSWMAVAKKDKSQRPEKESETKTE